MFLISHKRHSNMFNNFDKLNQILLKTIQSFLPYPKNVIYHHLNLKATSVALHFMTPCIRKNMHTNTFL